MIQLLLTYTCQRCDGTGQIYDPDNFGWADLFERARHADSAPDRTYGERLSALVDSHVAELGLQTEAPEEGACGSCGGSGEITETVDEAELRRALEALRRVELARPVREQVDQVAGSPVARS